MMEINNKIFPIWMLRENLQKIPEYSVPKGFSIRPFHPGDEKIWRKIQELADVDQSFTDESFVKIFGNDESILRERQWYLFDISNQPIGTITAWFDDYFSKTRQGRIHWLAVVPAQQGHGFGKILLSFCLQQLRKLSYRSAYLKTWPTRLPAINLYLQFGFFPWLSGPDEIELWRGLQPSLKTQLRLENERLFHGSRPRLL